jgi:hypothetical protein
VGKQRLLVLIGLLTAVLLVRMLLLRMLVMMIGSRWWRISITSVVDVIAVFAL